MIICAQESLYPPGRKLRIGWYDYMCPGIPISPWSKAKDRLVMIICAQESLYAPGRKLRIGWYDYDGFFPATPGCKRAVR